MVKIIRMALPREQKERLAVLQKKVYKLVLKKNFTFGVPVLSTI